MRERDLLDALHRGTSPDIDFLFPEMTPEMPMASFFNALASVFYGGRVSRHSALASGSTGRNRPLKPTLNS
jgi:hypothetical protein